MTPNPEDRLGGTDGLEFEPVETRPQPRRHWGRWISFAIVVVVGAGGGWYFFGDQLAMITPEKSVPVIRAEVAPIKIKPADPGGMDVPDRDKLVYDRLNGEGAGTNVERLLPPPETPLPIPEGQLQGAATNAGEVMAEARPLVPETAAPEAETLTQQMTESATQQENVVDPNAPVPLQPSTVTEAAETATAPEAPPPPPAPVEPVEVAPVTPTTLEPAATTAQQETQAVAQSTQQATATQATPPSEPITPSAADTVIQSQAAASATTAATKEYRIQLAALRTHERAEAEWKRQKKAHPDILGALNLSVVRVDLGEDKGVFFRLRAGPLKDSASAKKLCGELAKRNVGCLVIRPGK